MNKRIKRALQTGVLLASALLLVACGESEPQPIEDISFEPQVSEQDYLAVRAEKEAYYIDLYEKGEPAEIKALDNTRYKKLNYQQALDFVEQKKSGIIYFGWVECPYCVQFRQIFDQVLEDLDQEVYMIERSDFISKAKQNEIYDLYNVEYVPSILVMHEGKEVTRMGQNLSLNTFWYPDMLDWMVDMSKVVVEGPTNNQDLIEKHTEPDPESIITESYTGEELQEMADEQGVEDINDLELDAPSE